MTKIKIQLFIITACVFAMAACQTNVAIEPGALSAADSSEVFEKPKLAEIESPQIRKILESANRQTETTTSYSQKYYTIEYPNGDVPADTGACTDVIVRSFRAADVDLQKLVHEDMSSNFSSYPTLWGLDKPDSNIDHRRVLNLRRLFERSKNSLPVTSDAENYKPGDVVTWDLNGKGLTHTGMVSNMWNNKTNRYLIIHNIGRGTRLEDRLFEWEITGHYRYF